MRSQKQAEYISTSEVEAEYGKLNAVKSNGKKPERTRNDPLVEFIRENWPEADAERIVKALAITAWVVLAAILIPLGILGLYWVEVNILASFKTGGVIAVFGIIVALGMIGYGVARNYLSNHNRPQ